MTQAEYEAEMCFRLCKSIFSKLAPMGPNSENDAQALLRAAAEKYSAPIGELEVRSVAAEKGYTG